MYEVRSTSYFAILAPAVLIYLLLVRFCITSKGWYSKGSDLGDAECRYRLGLLMIVDDCTDDKDGFEKILSAALEGCTEAAYATGRCYLRGIGTDADVSEAKKWLKLAADAGLKDAQDDLDSIGSDD